MRLELNLIPSKIHDRHWVESAAPCGNWPPNSGKWLLFIAASRVDSVWRMIDQETKSGCLGIAAKVAIAKPNPMATKHFRIICIYTYDFTDVNDVSRVPCFQKIEAAFYG